MQLPSKYAGSTRNTILKSNKTICCMQLVSWLKPSVVVFQMLLIKQSILDRTLANMKSKYLFSSLMLSNEPLKFRTELNHKYVQNVCKVFTH